MQDGENPVESGAAPSSAPSNASKSGFKLDFSPETMQLKQKAATLAGMGRPKPISTSDTSAEPKIEAHAGEAPTMESTTPANESVAETAEFSSDPELAAAQAEFAAEPQLSGEVDMEAMMAADGAAHIEEAINSEDLPNEAAVESAAEENSFADAPTNVITAPKGNPTSSAPQKHGPNPKIIAFICIIGILVVSIVVVVILHLVSSATPVVEEAVEEIEETVQETSKGKERKVVKKPTSETQEEEPPVEEQPVEETPSAPAEEPVVDENVLQIDIPEANTRIKIPLDGSFITYRKVGNKITFWAATKREEAADDENAEAQENCVSATDSGDEQTNCGPDVPEFADKYVNTKGMASLTWWKAANPDTGETVFESEPWYIVYSTGMQSSFSTDEAEGAWESESTMYLYDLLTNAEIYEVLTTE